MSIYTKRVKKNGVKIITSSYFDDIKMLRQSIKDTGVSQLRHDKDCKFDVSLLMISSAAQQISLWRQGCFELSQYVESMRPEQWKNYETAYMGESPDESEDTALVMSEEEAENFKDAYRGKRMKFN